MHCEFLIATFDIHRRFPPEAAFAVGPAVADNLTVMRFFRILRTLIALLSLSSAFAIAALWIRSYFVADDFQRTTSHDLPTRLRWNNDHLMIGNGGIGVCHTAWSAPVGGAPQWGTTPFVRDSSLSYQRLPPMYPQFVFPPLPQMPLG